MSALDKRMKEFYEFIPKTKLMRRCPVAIRIDGKAFHTFTRGFKKPFDKVMIETMQETTQYLCENIQGCVLGYTQSDEITLILIDYKNLESSAWFDYEVQKICSVAASMATMQFNRLFAKKVAMYKDKLDDLRAMKIITDTDIALGLAYEKSLENGAMFDARCFNIPKDEVCNLIYWRQQDASRNSIQMLARTYYSSKQLQGKKNTMIQDMLFKDFGINWNDCPVVEKRGTACIKDEDGKWFIDENMPILRAKDRQYVEKLIYLDK